MQLSREKCEDRIYSKVESVFIEEFGKKKLLIY